MNPIQLFDTNLSSFTYLLFDESSWDALTNGGTNAIA